MNFRTLSKLSTLACALILASAWSSIVEAARQPRINLGTLAPQGSTYHKSLMAMRESWREAPGGGANLVIYPDGSQGGEADMVRLMRIGMLQSGLFSAVGLSEIAPDVTALQNMPMVFRSFAEFDYVSERLQPRLEKQLLEKGYVVLFWMDAGWVRFFSKKPILRPDDLRKLKMFVWAGADNSADILRRHGFKPVELETTEILTGMQTGLIDTVAAPPIFALATQLDRTAPHMLELNYAPLVGAAIIKKDAWDKLPRETQNAMLAAAQKAGREIRANGRKEAEEAVTAMQKRGLSVSAVPLDAEAEWQEVARKAYKDIRGDVVPAVVFDEVLALLEEYRSR